jgi:hypothetical protein
METGAQDGQRNLLLCEPLRERRKSGVDPDLLAKQLLGLGEGHADAAHFSGDAVAQTQLALADQAPDCIDHPLATAQTRRQKDQSVLFTDCAVEVGEDVWFRHPAPSIISDFDARRGFEYEFSGRRGNILPYVREDEVGALVACFDDREPVHLKTEWIELDQQFLEIL